MNTLAREVNAVIRSAVSVGIVMGLSLLTAMAQEPVTLVYDIETNPGFHAANAWSTDSRDAATITFDQTWVDGSIVAFPAGYNLVSKTVLLTEDVMIANFNLGTWGNHNPNVVSFKSETGAREMRFNGVLDFMATWGFQFMTGVSIQGDFTMTRGWLRNAWTHDAPYAGTSTLKGSGKWSFGHNNQLGTNSHFVVEGGTLDLGAGNPIGSIELNSGTVDHQTSEVLVKRFSGTGGILRTKVGDKNFADTTASFTVGQEADTTFGGEIKGIFNMAKMQFIKTGSGSLTLDGKIELITETQVTGGSLYINNANTVFSDSVGTTAISVDGATLGGTGTITVTNAANVVLSATGKLVAGLAGAAGRTTYALNGGTLDLSAATASTNTGWLTFDLGDPTTAGVTYDQIKLSAGTLNIGTGLDFDAFDIQLSLEPKSGSYILFETSEAIIGSLGNTTGRIAGSGGVTGELRIDGNNLILDLFVPPAGTMILVR